MSERTSLDTLVLKASRFFRRNAGRFGLNAKKVEARYILNWGGYVNASFTITDGARFYHLKLADDEGVQEDLARWRSLHEYLSNQYHAPRMLDWVVLPDTGFAGPLFEHVPGRPVDLSEQTEILSELLAMLQRLHSDAWLVEALDGGELGTCTDYFLDVYIERFDEDLLGIVAQPPPFVSLDLIDWMMGETREMEGLARDLPAFHCPADSPTHGDLWSSNILVTSENGWYIIDWDDLALGDPALEYSILLGTLWRDGQRSMSELEQWLPADNNLRERFRVCLRAYLLDQVIDKLADWVEAGFAPEHQEQVRAEKERQHRDAVKLYCQLYGSLECPAG